MLEVAAYSTTRLLLVTLYIQSYTFYSLEHASDMEREKEGPSVSHTLQLSQMKQAQEHE